MMGKWDALARGFELGKRMVQDYEAARDRKDMRGIDQAKPEQSEGFTAEQGDQLRAAAESGQYDIGYDDAKKAYTVTPKAGGDAGVIAQQGITDFLGHRVAGVMSQDAMDKARTNAMADVVARSNPVAAQRMRREQVQAERDDRRFGWEQERVDRDGQRFGWDKSKAEREQQEAVRRDREAAELQNAMSDTESQDDPGQGYLQNAVPRVVNVLVKQGKLKEAQQYQEFAESQEGKKYASLWTRGVRALSFGDTTSAIKSFEELYNSQLFNDGMTASFTPVKGAKDAFQIEIKDKAGKVVATQKGAAGDLANQAALFLDPMRAVEFHAKETAKRQSESATLDRQIQLESMRQQGRAFSEDRRDARMAARISAAAAGGDKPLSLSQQRANQEIDVSRRMVQGVDPAELKRKTTPTGQWGGRNPDYDPALARAASLANRRKFGEDSDFDGRGAPAGGPQGGQSVASVPDKFKADKNMQGNRLGKQTDRGHEVFDSKGKLIGYYR